MGWGRGVGVFGWVVFALPHDCCEVVETFRQYPTSIMVEGSMMSATMDQKLGFSNSEEQGAPQAAVLVMEVNPQQAAGGGCELGLVAVEAGLSSTFWAPRRGDRWVVEGGCDMSAELDQGQGRDKIARQLMDEVEQEAQRWVRDAARTDALLRVSRIKQRSAWTHSSEVRKSARKPSSDRSG